MPWNVNLLFLVLWKLNIVWPSCVTELVQGSLCDFPMIPTKHNFKRKPRIQLTYYSTKKTKMRRPLCNSKVKKMESNFNWVCELFHLNKKFMFKIMSISFKRLQNIPLIISLSFQSLTNKNYFKTLWVTLCCDENSKTEACWIKI